MNKEILEITKNFHDTYEKLASEYAYKTREDTKVFNINSNNGKLMYATVNEIVNPILKENQELKDNWEMLKHNLKVVIKRYNDYCKKNSTNEFDIDYLIADTTMKNYAAFLSIVKYFEGNDSNE